MLVMEFMLKGLKLVLLWFGTSLTVLFSALFYLAEGRNGVFSFVFQPRSSGEVGGVFASLPSVLGWSEAEFEIDEARPAIIENYLRIHHSPMQPYDKIARFLFETSLKYGLDFRLLVAIAQCESNLGKRMPHGSFNPFGYGIYGDQVTKFSSWEEGIETVARKLREEYVNKRGLTTVESIMRRYTPPALEKGGSWGKCVNQFLKELE